MLTSCVGLNYKSLYYKYLRRASVRYGLIFIPTKPNEAPTKRLEEPAKCPLVDRQNPPYQSGRSSLSPDEKKNHKDPKLHRYRIKNKQTT